MASAHDIGNIYLTTMKHLPGTKPPLFERDAETREIDGKYRIGRGVSLRIPFTRRCIVIGRWIDEGGDEEVRLREALQASDLDHSAEQIEAW